MVVLDHVASAIVAFGEQLGFSDLRLNDEGALNLVLEGGDTFAITTLSSYFMVSLAILGHEHERAELMERGFHLVGLALEEGRQMNLGLKESKGVEVPAAALVVSSPLPMDQVSVDTLYDLFETLWDFRQQLKA